MRPRAVPDLLQRPDEERLAEFATGMRCCLTNALHLWRDVTCLAKAHRPQGVRILMLLAEEEAAKFHILLDAARCPPDAHDLLARQLKYFSQHLARGLYARYNEWRPMDFGEAQRHLDRERQALYLDGPNDVDWIFRNDIERQREEAMYVDYVAYDNHDNQRHAWHCPNRGLLRMYVPLLFMPRVLCVADALHHAGITDPAGLRIAAETWRAVNVQDGCTLEQTQATNALVLSNLNDHGLFRSANPNVLEAVRYQWCCPLYLLDLRELPVAPATLHDIQANWQPPDMY
jgi:AbiV family abortive infection protein